MREIAFTIPVSGIIRIDEHSISITVNQAETTVTYEPVVEEERPLPKGTTIFDVLLKTAQQHVGSNAQSTFTTSDLYHDALGQYPNLRRNTWGAHVIASAPDHPSYRHHSSQRAFFDYLGDGTYRLKRQYVNARKSSAGKE